MIRDMKVVAIVLAAGVGSILLAFGNPVGIVGLVPALLTLKQQHMKPEGLTFEEFARQVCQATLAVTALVYAEMYN